MAPVSAPMASRPPPLTLDVTSAWTRRPFGAYHVRFPNLGSRNFSENYLLDSHRVLKATYPPPNCDNFQVPYSLGSDLSNLEKDAVLRTLYAPHDGRGLSAHVRQLTNNIRQIMFNTPDSIFEEISRFHLNALSNTSMSNTRMELTEQQRSLVFPILSEIFFYVGRPYIETPQDPIVDRIRRWQMDIWRQRQRRVRLTESRRQAYIDQQNDLRQRNELRERQRKDLEQRKRGFAELQELRQDEDVALVMGCVICQEDVLERTGVNSACCKESFMCFLCLEEYSKTNMGRQDRCPICRQNLRF